MQPHRDGVCGQEIGKFPDGLDGSACKFILNSKIQKKITTWVNPSFGQATGMGGLDYSPFPGLTTGYHSWSWCNRSLSWVTLSFRDPEPGLPRSHRYLAVGVSIVQSYYIVRVPVEILLNPIRRANRAPNSL